MIERKTKTSSAQTTKEKTGVIAKQNERRTKRLSKVTGEINLEIRLYCKKSEIHFEPIEGTNKGFELKIVLRTGRN